MLKLVILDVDGVMCSNKIYDKEHNVIGKTFNDVDFTAIKCFKALGINVVFLTSDRFNAEMAQARKIECFSGINSKTGKIDKIGVYFNIIQPFYKVHDSEVAYLGDDIFDVPLLQKVGFSFCPENTFCKVQQAAKCILGKSGEGLVCEMFDYFVTNNLLHYPPIEDVACIDAAERS